MLTLFDIGDNRMNENCRNGMAPNAFGRSLKIMSFFLFFYIFMTHTYSLIDSINSFRSTTKQAKNLFKGE